MKKIINKYASALVNEKISRKSSWRKFLFMPLVCAKADKVVWRKLDVHVMNINQYLSFEKALCKM